MKHKKIIKDLIISGFVLVIIAIVISNIFGLNTQNSYFSLLSLIIILLPFCIAGILYSVDLKGKNIVICYAIRLIILFFYIVIFTLLITKVLGGLDG